MQTEHCMRNERLQVQDNILLEKNLFGKAGKTLHPRREVTGLGHYVAVKKSFWQGRQNTASSTRGYRFKTVFCCKKVILAMQAEHSVE